MNRMRRIAGMGKSKKAPSAVQKDKDESIVFFRELYKHEEDTDVNLLEPIYSVEFDAIQGGHMSKPPPGKGDLLVPINEKHDYDWPKTPPVAPMLPSLKMEMEASSSETVVSPKKKELPIPITQPAKPSASRFIGKTEAPKTSAKLPAGSSSSNYAKSQPCTTERRLASAYATLPNRQQNPDAKANTGTSSSSSRAHSHTYYANASQDSSGASTAKAVEAPGEAPYTAPKNLLTTGSIFARRRASTTAVARAPPLGVDAKVESAKARRPPSAAARTSKELQVDARKNALPSKGKAVAGGGSEPACNSGGRAGTSKTAPAKGMRKTDGKNERRPRFADQ
ncbi:uncharacterized protein LOC119337078 [Triticum dicoccoides]|uniref:uncharacterized protein LOC119337078 n=1 Tax=Triticum dicoccoides TaxID=85692 RepID=UPI001890E4BB|nr:uncharacterized protein LOC119337078 [Triticum dicoccoides]